MHDARLSDPCALKIVSCFGTDIECCEYLLIWQQQWLDSNIYTFRRLLLQLHIATPNLVPRLHPIFCLPCTMAQADSSAVIQGLSDAYVLTTLSEMQKNLPELALHSTTSPSQRLVCVHVLSNSTISTACSTALLVYDTLLTLPSEIRYIWCKAIKLGAILYLIARYMPLVVYVILMYTNFSNVSLEVYYFYGSLEYQLY
jgi:Family of unknown function (DUF6533)